MRFVQAPVILAIAVILGACTHLPQWGNTPHPIEPEAVGPGLAQASNNLVVLLPKANGSVGAVVVRSGGSGPVVLERHYAAARIAGAGRVQPLTYDADLAKKEFSAALTALPDRPVIFL